MNFLGLGRGGLGRCAAQLFPVKPTMCCCVYLNSRESIFPAQGPFGSNWSNCLKAGLGWGFSDFASVTHEYFVCFGIQHRVFFGSYLLLSAIQIYTTHCRFDREQLGPAPPKAGPAPNPKKSSCFNFSYL